MSNNEPRPLDYFPTVKHPVFTFTRPSNGATIKYCPYTVREEKILLMAAESGDPKDITSATKTVVQNCIAAANGGQTTENIGSWPVFDVNYAFILCRARAVSSIVQVDFKCMHKDEDGNSCDNPFTIELNIDKVQVLDDHTSKNGQEFQVGEFLVKMRYPTYNSIDHLKSTANATELSESIVADAIEAIYSGNESWNHKDHARSKFIKFVESLSAAQFKPLKDYVENMPRFVIRAEHTCSKCGFVHKQEFDDLIRFF